MVDAAVAAYLDRALSDAEAALEKARKAREGREDVRPDSRTADQIAADIEALVADANKRKR